MICGSTSRSTIVQLLPPSVCALAISSGGISVTRLAMSRTMTGATPTAISVTFAVSPSPKRDEQDRQQRQRRDHADDGDEGQQQGAHARDEADGDTQHERGQRRCADTGEQPEQAGIGVDPQDEIAGALVGHGGELQEGRPHLRRRRQQLVAGVDGEPLRRRRPDRRSPRRGTAGCRETSAMPREGMALTRRRRWRGGRGEGRATGWPLSDIALIEASWPPPCAGSELSRPRPAP